MSLHLPKPTPREIGERFQLQKYVGHGSYGQVYSGVDTVDGAKVAIKCIQDVFRTTEDAKRTLREICILRQCRHPNIISCRSVLRPPDAWRFENIWIVLEMCDWDLRKVMNTRMKQWTFEHVKRLMHQTLSGLAYLHSAKVVHRDLKPANILVTASCDIRICDFGLSRQIISRRRHEDWRELDLTDRESLSRHTGASGLVRTLTKHVVTRYYRAPELILLSSDYTETVDVWSVGCIFAELLATLEPNAPRDSKRILFPGDSGYPVSATSNPDDIDDRRLEREMRKPASMLSLIFGVLGTPTYQDINDVTDSEPMRQALRNMEPIAPKSFARRYNASPDEAIDLLQKMLLLNPRTRITSADCLRHPCMAKMVGSIDPDHGTCMNFPFEAHKQNKHSLRQLLLSEVDYFEPFDKQERARERTQKVLADATQSHANGQFDAAIEHFEEALKLAADAHVPQSQSIELIADIESKLDTVKKAKAAAAQVAEEAQSYVAAAKEHTAKEDFEAAIASYESALKRAREAQSLGESIASEADAEMVSLRRCAAQAFQRTQKAIADATQSHANGQFDAAIEHFEEALKLAADAHVPQSQSIELIADIESKLDTVKKAKAAAAQVAEEAQSYVAAAKEHTAKEDFEAAIASYESALKRAREAQSLGESIASEADAEMVSLRRCAAQAFQRTQKAIADATQSHANGQFDAAIEHFEEALKLAADAHVPQSQSIELIADIESKLDTVKKAKAAAAQVAEEAQSYVAAAKEHTAKEDFEAAIASYESALKRAREAQSLGESIASEADAEMVSLRRCAAQAFQRTQKAIADATQSHANGQFDAAIEHFEEALKLAADAHVPQSQSIELIADIESKLDTVKKAKAAAAQVAEEAQSYVAAAKEHTAKEDFEAAIASYESALKRAREAQSLGESIASEADAEMVSLRRCAAQAFQRTQKAIADATQSHANGQFDAAIEHFEEALKLAADAHVPQSQSIELIADIESKLDTVKKAKAAYIKAQICNDQPVSFGRIAIAGQLGTIEGWEKRLIGPNVYMVRFDGEAQARRVKLKQGGCCSAPQSHASWNIPLNKQEEISLVTKRKGKGATVEEAVPPVVTGDEPEPGPETGPETGPEPEPETELKQEPKQEQEQVQELDTVDAKTVATVETFAEVDLAGIAGAEAVPGAEEGAEDCAKKATVSLNAEATTHGEADTSWSKAMAELQELAKDLDARTLQGEVQRLRKARFES